MAVSRSQESPTQGPAHRARISLGSVWDCHSIKDWLWVLRNPFKKNENNEVCRVGVVYGGLRGMIYSPSSVDRIRGIWGSYYEIPKDYSLKVSKVADTGLARLSPPPLLSCYRFRECFFILWQSRRILIVPLKYMEYGFGYIIVRSPYTRYSIYLRGTILLCPARVAVK